MKRRKNDMKRENKRRVRSVLALGLAGILAWPNMNWSIFANATDNAEESVYFFFDDRMISTTENVEYSINQVAEENKVMTSFLTPELYSVNLEENWETVKDEDGNELYRYDASAAWEVRSAAFDIEYDESTGIYKMWRSFVAMKAPGATFDWRDKIIDNTNINNISYDTGTYQPQGIMRGKSSMIVCNLLAPIFSLVSFSSAAISAIASIASGVNSRSILSTSSNF